MLNIPRQAQLSPEARDLILRLCTNPERRLGVNGVEEIKCHPFFKSVDWDYGVRRMQAPYIPKINFPTDTSNFDAIEESDTPGSGDDGPSNETKETIPREGRHPEHAFYEFTFRRFFNDDSGNAFIPAQNYSSDDSASDTSKEAVYV